MKPKIFIGSSATNLPTLEKVQAILADVGECVPWTNAFEQNRSNPDSLVLQTKLAEFSVMLAMKDDLLEKKGVSYEVARDNVIFEFGLFLGSAGLNRAFMLVEEGINLPTDLDGITLSRFTLELGKHNTLEKVVEELKKAIIKSSEGSNLGLLPSTALAMGYYHNFIWKLCDELHTVSRIQVGEGAEKKEYKVKDFVFNIIIPSNIDDKGVDSFKAIYHKKHSLNSASTATTVSSKRGYPFVFKLEPPEQDQDGELIIEGYDIPTTLNTILETLQLFLPRDQVGYSAEKDHLEKRELANFAKVLNYLVSKNTATKDNVKIHENVSL
ncbi:MAG: hypothetical protein EOO15_00410 [Chitinophagaceae bacterium]|nr:MAG: hypothetical protein EOO15_00410 [Chitinophagaceae bacterium]